MNMDFLKVKEDETDKFNFWRVRHTQAVSSPQGVESAVIDLLTGLEQYRKAHSTRFGSKVEDDGVLGDGRSCK